MKTQLQPQLQQGQDQQQWWQQQAANDPDYQIWLDRRSVENQAAFEAFLDTPEGQKWLDTQRALEDAKFFAWIETPQGIAWMDYEAESHIHPAETFWNHDGFNPVIYA